MATVLFSDIIGVAVSPDQTSLLLLTSDNQSVKIPMPYTTPAAVNTLISNAGVGAGSDGSYDGGTFF